MSDFFSLLGRHNLVKNEKKNTINKGYGWEVVSHPSSPPKKPLISERPNNPSTLFLFPYKETFPYHDPHFLHGSELTASPSQKTSSAKVGFQKDIVISTCMNQELVLERS